MQKYNNLNTYRNTYAQYIKSVFKVEVCSFFKYQNISLTYQHVRKAPNELHT